MGGHSFQNLSVDALRRRSLETMASEMKIIFSFLLVATVYSLWVDATCTDKMPGQICQNLVTKDQCRKNEYVQKQCPKSCFDCKKPPPKPCQNQSSKCSSWRK